MRYVPLYFLLFFSCNETYLPKQKAYFAPSFETKQFTLFSDNCENEFLINSLTEVNEISNCSYELIYENLNSTVNYTANYMDNCMLTYIANRIRNQIMF